MTPISDLRAAPHLLGRRVDLAWTNPSAAEGSLAGVRIVRRERAFARDEEDGQVIYDGPAITSYSDTGLAPLTTYYYTIFAFDGAAYHADRGSNASAFAAEGYGLAERLYRLLPGAVQRLDAPLRPDEIALLDPAIQAALAALPPDLSGRGQLRRLFHAAAAPLDLLRSFAEGLRQLRDIDRTRPEFLAALADFVGWELDRTLPVHAQRNEIKFAFPLYRDVGTVPNLRAFVTRYTGWYVRVGELAQAIARTSSPPQLNIFAIADAEGIFKASDDAATVLGFGPGYDSAVGSGSPPPAPGGVAAELESASGPFALRPGMELTLRVDERIPVVVRFGPGDFEDIGAATAAEVASVLDAALSEATITVSGGRLKIRSNTVGASSSLQVERAAATPITLEGAPRGRLSVIDDPSPGGPRARLFYEARGPLAPWELGEIAAAVGGAGPDTAGGQGQVRYKTYRRGCWGPSHALPFGRDVPRGEPAAALWGTRVFLAWIEHPGTEQSRIRFTLGLARSPRPARVVGKRSGPFALAAGARLVVRGSFPAPEGFELSSTDLAVPGSGTISELVNAINARMSRVQASEGPNGTLALETVAAGGDERLEVDLALSTAAGALGFDDSNAAADGDFGDEIDWDGPTPVPAAPDPTPAAPRRYADLFALAHPEGIVVLFWAEHNGSRWVVTAASWNGGTWDSSALLGDGGGSNREPCAVLDAADRICIFWSQLQDPLSPEEVWTLRRRVFDPAGGTLSAEDALTSAPIPPGRASDREPGAVRLQNGDIRVFFRSDRGGGQGLWCTTFTPPAGSPSAPVAITSGAAAALAPAPIRMSDGRLWVLFRSDRSVSPSRRAGRPFTPPDNRVTSSGPEVGSRAPGPPRSLRAPDTGTLQRHCGTTTAPLTHLTRLGRRRHWDDMLSYTPQRPEGGALADDDLYTRETVALYLSEELTFSPVSRVLLERLRPMLGRFLPINTRAVVILAPPADVEGVYTPGADLSDAFLDDIQPVVERFAAVEDSAAAALPDWSQLLTNTAGHLSANPADLTTLRRRVFFQPPE